MASYAETTSVQIRRGNHAENMGFCGVVGEVSADLGVRGDGTDIETTLRLHNGITNGGIALARADAVNISTAGLAENRGYVGDKNLAYADLSNIETLSSTTAINRVLNTLNSYGLAKASQVEALQTNKANTNMDNVYTSTLASGRIPDGNGNNGNLAYANMHNVNSKYLALQEYRMGEDGDNALAYANLSNIDTTNLVTPSADRPETMTGPIIAQNDLSNVDNASFNDIFFGVQRNFLLETSRNKITEMSDGSTSNTTYPSSGAVINYVQDKIDEAISGGSTREYMKKDFSNTETWDALYEDNNSTSKKIFKMELENGGAGYTEGYHALSISCGTTTNLRLLVNTVDTNNVPTSVTIVPTFGYEDFGEDTSLTFENSKGDTITIKIISNNLEFCYEYTNEILSSNVTQDGFVVGNKYDCTIITTVTPYNSINITSVDENGTILTYEQAYWNIVSEYTPESITSDVLHLVSETGDNGSIIATVSNVIPSIGGAGLLKKTLSNLEGMTNDDINGLTNHALYINPEADLPDLSNPIPAREYGHIVTAGKLAEAMNNSWTGSTRVTYRIWS